MQNAVPIPPRPILRPDSGRRLACAGLGVLSVIAGAIGTVVPGWPTTVFLLVGSWLLTRSCPVLEQRLIRNRLFGPYLRHLDGSAVMPRRARVAAIATMWISVGISTALLLVVGTPVAVVAIVLAAAGAGTWFIARGATLGGAG